MPVESGDYLSDLVITDPPDSEAKKFGAGYLRFIKKALKQSFPNITGAVTATQAQLNALLTGPTITSTDAGAAAGPTIDLHRDSASPAAADELGALLFSGEDSASNKTTFARILAAIVDATDASEDARLEFDTIIAGSLARRGYLGNGLVLGAATGGDKGLGTINLAALPYVNGGVHGWPLIATRVAVSDASLIFTPGLGFNATLYAGYYCLFENITPETDGANFLWEVSVDTGANYLTDANYHLARWAGGGTSAIASAGGTTQTAITLASAISAGAAGSALRGFATIISGGAVSLGTVIEFQGNYGLQTTGERLKTASGGGHATATAVNAWRWRMSSGDFSGTIRIYGIPKA